MIPCHQDRVGHAAERVIVSISCEVEVRHITEGCGENFLKDPEVGTASLTRNGNSTKSFYLTFDPGGMYTINWKTLYQELESNKAYRGETKKVQRKSYKHLKIPAQILAK